MCTIFAGITVSAVGYVAFRIWVLKTELRHTLEEHTSRVIIDITELRAKVLWLEAEVETIKPGKTSPGKAAGLNRS